jgi:hypothetical protein
MNTCDFQGELVDPNPGAGTWEDFLNLNIKVSDGNIFKHLKKDLIDH